MKDIVVAVFPVPGGPRIQPKHPALHTLSSACAELIESRNDPSTQKSLFASLCPTRSRFKALSFVELLLLCSERYEPASQDQTLGGSALQEGPFALLYSSGNIVSSVITIEPSAALVIDGGLTIDIPIDGSKEMCSQILQNVQMVVVSDLLNFNATPEGLGNCSMGSVGNCSCAATIYHFSTYAVANAYYTSPTTDSGTTNTNSPGSDTTTTTTTTTSTEDSGSLKNGSPATTSFKVKRKTGGEAELTNVQGMMLLSVMMSLGAMRVYK
ncbi:hypothetical protein GUITHDRAFT_99326 [Guillardia theta CCMP2712]|uniref:Uncharacterized protein n=1 Tax=Guillardia theta (strain CCMP2712) TaxID=905079 RepID=L1K3Z6_GUITC|nr:hypothetical protein GUITHDRAFT_99326 [Guillardia theta CCMP2712]EKX55551.1 hypothetical protein GUITHDRAFT_99326 [Guillardia theta CCMP2712]|eukprot:XP_005842531.1 hypothetical protein GUITHDRAFT_99326 [Guillardia theta CCMP2712]